MILAMNVYVTKAKAIMQEVVQLAHLAKMSMAALRRQVALQAGMSTPLTDSGISTVIIIHQIKAHLRPVLQRQ